MERKRCIHCLRLTEKTEADHIFPSSWYPDTTPAAVQRWTAPSCSDCNRELGQLEKDLLIRMIPCIDPKSAAVSGLMSKVSRSLGIDTGNLPKNEKETRDMLAAKIRSEIMPHAQVAELPGKIPGLGPPASTLPQWAIPIPWAALSIVTEKIARGCEYKLKNRFIEPPYGIRTGVGESDLLVEPYASAAAVLDLGPGCRIRRVFATEDSRVVLYWISVWGCLYFHARINLETELQKLDPSLPKCEGLTPPEKGGMRISTYLRNVNQHADVTAEGELRTRLG